MFCFALDETLPESSSVRSVGSHALGGEEGVRKVSRAAGCLMGGWLGGRHGAGRLGKENKGTGIVLHGDFAVKRWPSAARLGTSERGRAA